MLSPRKEAMRGEMSPLGLKARLRCSAEVIQNTSAVGTRLCSTVTARLTASLGNSRLLFGRKERIVITDSPQSMFLGSCGEDRRLREGVTRVEKANDARTLNSNG
jgi:hypothetical protein